ncbi:hypothetical protein PVAP13_3KG249327 [Panicum virgatum]|uniref:Uncharacterized protein n=1 Tax=Panicum virgatum TaxID=38727 RepID=A0A8T0V557_PANVG|nr:hypothetical protein PVAP13_3KG249327 [Panicum virgatum]
MALDPEAFHMRVEEEYQVFLSRSSAWPLSPDSVPYVWKRVGCTAFFVLPASSPSSLSEAYRALDEEDELNFDALRRSTMSPSPTPASGVRLRPKLLPSQLHHLVSKLRACGSPPHSAPQIGRRAFVLAQVSS